MVNGPHFCYIIVNDQNYTYNGYTNNPIRRLKQHCGLLKGGAKYTTRRGQHWNYIALIECINTSYTESLSCEYRIKYPNGHKPRPKKYNTPENRIKSLYEVFTHTKFSEKLYNVYIKSEFIDCLQELCNELKNIEIKPLELFLESLNDLT